MYYTYLQTHTDTHTPGVPADVVHSEAWLTPGVQHHHQLLLEALVAADKGLGQRQFVLQDERHAHLQGRRTDGRTHRPGGTTISASFLKFAFVSLVILQEIEINSTYVIFHN